MDPASEAPASFEFGRFRVLPQRREVLADGQPMELGGRAFDILVVLIEAHGAVVSKDELMRRVWPGRIVEDNNLHAQIKALRRAFSDHDLIRTVVGRGYQFRAEVRPRLGNHIERAQPGTASNVSAPRAPTNLPAQTSDVIGREVEIAEVIGLLTDHRFVTLTGTGGSVTSTMPDELWADLPIIFSNASIRVSPPPPVTWRTNGSKPNRRRTSSS